MIADEATHLTFRNFYQTKNGTIEPPCILISKLHNQSITTKCERQDNAGEKNLWETLKETSGNLT